MYSFFRNLAFATALITAPVTAEEWPEALKMALADPNDEAHHSYKLTIEAESSDEDAIFFIEAFIDLSRPPEERVEILFPPPGSETGNAAEMIQEIKDSTPGDIWCSSESENIPKDVILVDETADTLVFSYRLKVDKEMKKRERKLTKKLEGKIVIDKKTMTVKSSVIKNRKPIRVAIVALIRTFQLETKCEMAPNGHSYRAKQVHTLEFSALGRRGVETTTVSITDLKPVRTVQ